MKPVSYIGWDNLLAEYIFLKVVINYIDAYLNYTDCVTSGTTTYADAQKSKI